MEQASKRGAVLVLGADSDLGTALIAELEGDIVAHHFITKDVLDGINCENRTVIPVYGDLSTIEGIKEFINGVKETGREINRIVHLPASPAKPARLTKFDPELLIKEINIEVNSIAMVMGEFFPVMASNNFGRVAVVLTSYCIGVPPKFLSTYVSAKYALMGLIKSAAVEYADKGITVNAVAPSMIETKFLLTLPDFEIEANAKANPLGRNASPDDIVPMLKILIGEDLPYMSGAVIPITGASSFY